MHGVNSARTAAVFFCLSGWVCVASANGAEAPDLFASTPAATQPAKTPDSPGPAGNLETPATAPALSGIGAVLPGAEPGAGAVAGAGAGALPGAGADNAPTTAPNGQQVNFSSFGQIDLHVKDLELTKVLQLLSIQSQRNIIAGKSVTGSVTADLFNVGFFDALRAILQPNGYGFKEQGNFIYIYTAAEIKDQQNNDRKTISKVVRLNYIPAADASTFVTKLLSSAGSIALNGPVGDTFLPSTTDNGSDKFANTATLVIVDYPENVQTILDVLKQLDVPPKQVLIEATVLEVNINEANAWGVDISAIASMHVQDFTNPLSGISDIAAGTVKGRGEVVSSTPTSAAAKAGSFQVGILANHVSAFLSALEQVTTTHVLAHPKMLVLNRQKADLLVGKQLAYISTTNTATASTQTVNYLNTGTELTVRPFISDEGVVRLELKPSIINGTLRQVGGTTVPDADTQSITTNILVPNGQTVVLGGLFTESTTVTRNQMPGLGDIPLLGAAFKGHDDSVLRSETIFLVTPTIVRDEAIAAAGARAADDAELSRIGAREGLLPWSKSKVTAGYMRDALKYRAEGRKDKALWDINRALTLDPSYAEARRLREDLGGERGNTTTRSLLDEAVGHAIGGASTPAPAPPAGK